MNCPCHSKKMYADCCEPYHNGALVPDALKLMRSRFSAFAMHVPVYIIQTTHPKNVNYQLDHVKWKDEIEAFSKHTDFKGLEIIEFEPEGEEATVTFTARLEQGGEDASFTEKSSFRKENGIWLYYSGEVFKIQ